MADETKKRAARTDERRRLIVEVAASLFLEKGFHQTSIRDIAERAGISLGNLYNHFSGKPALIAAIATLEAEENDALLRPLAAATGEEAVLSFARTYLEACSRPENGILAAEVLSESFRNPEIRAGFMANRQNLVDALCSALEKGATPGRELRQRAEMILDLIEGAAIRRLLGGADRVDDEALLAAISRVRFG